MYDILTLLLQNFLQEASQNVHGIPFVFGRLTNLKIVNFKKGGYYVYH